MTLSRSFGSTLATTTSTARTGRWSLKRQTLLPGRPSLPRTSNAACTGAIYSAGAHLPAEHRNLVPQHQQLHVVGRRAPCQQHQPSQQLAEHQIEQSKHHPAIVGASVSLSEVAAQSLRPTFWHPQVGTDPELKGGRHGSPNWKRSSRWSPRRPVADPAAGRKNLAVEAGIVHVPGDQTRKEHSMTIDATSAHRRPSADADLSTQGRRRRPRWWMVLLAVVAAVVVATVVVIQLLPNSRDGPPVARAHPA